MQPHFFDRKSEFIESIAEYVYSGKCDLGFGGSYGLVGFAMVRGSQTNDKRYEFIAGIGAIESFASDFNSPKPLWRHYLNEDSPNFDMNSYACAHLGEIRQELRAHELYPVESELRTSPKGVHYLSLIPVQQKHSSGGGVQHYQSPRANWWFQQMHLAAEGRDQINI